MGLGVVRDRGLGRGVVWRARSCGVDGRTVVAGGTRRLVVCGTRGRGVVLGLVGFSLGMAVVEGFLLITYSVKQKDSVKNNSDSRLRLHDLGENFNSN